MAAAIDLRRRTMIGCVLVVVTVVAIMFIYVYPIRAYYKQSQEQSRELRRLSVLKEANSKMKEERKDLSTDQEIIRIAREQYHLVKPGEDAYIVAGAPTTTAASTTTTAKP